MINNNQQQKPVQPAWAKVPNTAPAVPAANTVPTAPAVPAANTVSTAPAAPAVYTAPAAYTTSSVAAPVKPAPPCHTGNVHVFDFQRGDLVVEVWGGGTLHSSVHTVDFILLALQSNDDGDCAPVRLKGLAMPRLAKYSQLRVVHMDIPDGAIPGYPLNFWKDFIDELFDIAVKEPDHKAKLLVRCAGGHGRTGTVLAALLVAAQILPPETDPVAWIRTHYCTEAIETSAQIQYIELLSGVRSKEMPRPFPVGGAGTQAVSGRMTTAHMTTTNGHTQTGMAATSTDADFSLDYDRADERLLNDVDSVPLDDLYVFGFPETYPMSVEYDAVHKDWEYIYQSNNELLYTTTPPWVPGTANDGFLHGRPIVVVDYYETCCTVQTDDGTEFDICYPLS